MSDLMSENITKLRKAIRAERIANLRPCTAAFRAGSQTETEWALAAVEQEMDELERARDDARRERDALHVLDQCLRWRSLGVAAIAAERQRQVEREGWTPEHDAQHANGELIEAAVAYLRYELYGVDGDADWPFEAESFKPSENATRNLEKAGALVAAEVDRLYDRKAREAQGA